MHRSRSALSSSLASSLAASLLLLAPAAIAQTAPAPAEPTPAPTDAAKPAAADAPKPTRTLDRGSLLAPQAAPATPVTAAPRPVEAAVPTEVYAEDWWSHVRPALELHGYFRTRAELFHNFAIGRSDTVAGALWPRPADDSYTDRTANAPHTVKLCNPQGSTSSDPSTFTGCTDRTQAGANLRFRIDPELHVSENLRIMSQIDLLDNLVLGSTPEGYYNQPSSSSSSGTSSGATGYQTVARGGYAPLGVFSTTQVPPTAGVNSLTNSIAVKRVWGEYNTPVGQLRFGRMPNHWGLGMVANSGDGYDSDWQSTVDRFQFTTGLKSLDLYASGSWDFPNEGATSQTVRSLAGGQPYDLAQLDDVNQYSLTVVRKRNPVDQRRELARGDVVVNGGMYFTYRNQVIANDTSGGTGDSSLGASSDQVQQGYTRRGAKMYVPDGWLQILYKKFRFELEAVTINGSIESTRTDTGNNYVNPLDSSSNGWKIRQYGVATQTEYKAIEDRLRLQFGFGWASGDPNLAPASGAAGSLSPSRSQNGLGSEVARSRTYSEFAFHPDYRVDLIFYRNILQRVQGSYYFRPSAEYDFSRSPSGQKLGGGAAIIWSRASEFIQTPGHHRDLGVELDVSLYYQSKDGALNDDPSRMGGFFTQLQYGVFFPLAGLDYLPGEKTAGANQGLTLETSTAQTLRWFVGIFY